MFNHDSLSLIILQLSFSCFAGLHEAFPHGLWTSLKHDLRLVLSAQRELTPLQQKAEAQAAAPGSPQPRGAKRSSAQGASAHTLHPSLDEIHVAVQ